ncbi:MAG TPA: ABC transporter substrate-binding protein, partial [Arcobacter sp.]|nr:ABC transporter substrate-binding protein [Arcobacter sp.]
MTKMSKIVAGVALLALLATPSMAAKKVKWKLAMTWPKTLAPLAT